MISLTNLSDRDLITIVDFKLSEHYPIALRGSTRVLVVLGPLSDLAEPICAQPTNPLDKKDSIARSDFCDHHRACDCNFDRAIRCTRVATLFALYRTPKSGKPGNSVFRVQKYPSSPPSWDPFKWPFSGIYFRLHAGTPRGGGN